MWNLKDKQSLVRQKVLDLMSEDVKELVIEWSLFDYLCLIYIFKTWVVDMCAVLSVFLSSSDPDEAQLLLLQMNREYK